MQLEPVLVTTVVEARRMPVIHYFHFREKRVWWFRDRNCRRGLVSCLPNKAVTSLGLFNHRLRSLDGFSSAHIGRPQRYSNLSSTIRLFR
jgi:hypothetical protein